MSEISPGSCTHDGDVLLLRYTVDLPHPVARVWEAVATAEGMREWLCAADPMEPRLGGLLTLHRLNGDAVVSGRVTAWDPESVAEYTVDPPHGRVRFHLEPGGAGAGSTVLRFTNEFRGTPEQKLDMMAAWHDHFERLAAALDGSPTDWAAWNADRWQELRELYARDEAPWPRWEP